MPDAHTPEALRQQARRDYADAAHRLRSWPLRLTGLGLLVLPDRWMRTFGGAASIYGVVCISEGLARAPSRIRRAVIAHEVGHIASGHCVATLSALILAIAYVCNSWGSHTTTGQLLANLGMLITIAVLILWALQERREFEADALATKVVPREDMALGLRWVADTYRDGVHTEAVKKRLQVLES